MPRRKGEKQPKKQRPPEQQLRHVLAVTMENVTELQLTSAVVDMAVLMFTPKNSLDEVMLVGLSIDRVRQTMDRMGIPAVLELRERYAKLLEHVDPDAKEE